MKPHRNIYSKPPDNDNYLTWEERARQVAQVLRKASPEVKALARESLERLRKPR